MMNKIFTIGLMIMAVVSSPGCSKNETPAAAETPPTQTNNLAEQKPLPTECFQQVPFEATWEQDPEAYGYEVSIGLRQENYYDFNQTSGVSKRFSKPLDRNLNYYIRVSKRTKIGLTPLPEFHIFVPSCARRASWKEQHPEYNEPISFEAK